MHEWLPRSIESLRDYNAKKFSADLIAGITVGLVALPLAMAFAISSGVPPQDGIYCAIVAGFLVSALGGTKVAIGGPTGAFVVVVAGIVTRYGLDGLFMCTMMAGVMLLVMGATGLGAAVKFIPRPVVIGFTNGIAVLIASTQIKDFLGVDIAAVPGDFIGRMGAVFSHIHTFSLADTTLASVSLATVLLWNRYFKRVPGYIVAMFLATGVAVVMHLPVETIGTRFGGIPAGLPEFTIPAFRTELIRPLIAPAITVAMLGAIESLMSAVVADRMSGDKHNPNVELMAQGVANIASPLFGGLPATGAIARTATNIRSGAQTPMAGMIHALTLLAVIVFAAPLARHIPLAALAAILLVVSYNMGEWAEIPSLLRMGAADVWVWLLTFALTVFADLTVAVQFGMILAALVFIRRVASTTTVSQVTEEYLEDGRVHILQDKDIPSYVGIIRIHGPFLFGTTEKLDTLTEKLATMPPVLVLRLRNMTALDATGLHAIGTLADKVRDSGRALILCGAPPQPAQLMRRAEFEQRVGKENICDNVNEALERARKVYPEVAPPEVKAQWKRRQSDTETDAKRQ